MFMHVQPIENCERLQSDVELVPAFASVGGLVLGKFFDHHTGQMAYCPTHPLPHRIDIVQLVPTFT